MNCVLFFLIVSLFVLLYFQKRKNEESIKQMKNDARQEYEELSNYINEFINNVGNSFDEVNNSVKNVSDKNDKSKETLNESIVRNDDKIKKIQNAIVNEHISTEKKIKILTDALKSVIDDNARLKKELEFFTKIDEDAARLNVSAYKEQEEQYMLKALAELRTETDSENIKSKANQEIPKEKKEIVVENKKNEEKIKKPLSVLDEEQMRAFEMMSSSNQNMIITGKAGTGKSFLLKLFVRANVGKKMVLLAPTGISAINVGGSTIHSAFGFTNLVNTSIEDLEKGIIKLNNNKQQVLHTVDAIIIDEISMVRSDTFEKIDRILKHICKNNRLFGGKQLILFGDLFQLPPIVKPDEYRYLQDRFGGIYFFNSDVYKQGNFRFIELSINHRQQEDAPFFNILNKIREGSVSSEELNTLNERTSFDYDELRRVIRLFPRKDEAERINKQELEKINSKEYVYDAIVTYSKPDMTSSLKWNSFPIEEHLRLRLGALVMMVVNDTEKRWANGTLGIVSGLGEDYVKVKISNKSGTTNEYLITKCSFEEQEAIYEDGIIKYETIFKVDQIPVTLAYAITIHKSQGLTYQRVACDVTECFAPGQAYVALSRCNTLSGLYLLKKVDSNLLKVDENVRDFYLHQIE